ncbi:aldo/keto reductase [Kitasatospora sp. NPDC096147]|uniref:aldo/keto reductase n=1 Tax=Kitasatospora sp. NPDC096147 TaxID=3364093 RepID=UPI00380620A9
MHTGATTTIGRNGTTVSRLGLGLASIGGLFSPVGDERARATVERAWQRGIRLFDTAPLYGYGLSERRTGAVLAGKPRSEFTLCTKAGLLIEPGGPDTQDGWPEGEATGQGPRFDFSYRGVHRSLEQSLDRLGLDRIDLLLLHDADHHYPQALAEGHRALAELRAAGTVGAIGVGLTQAPLLVRFALEAPAPGFDCFLLGGRHTLLDHSGLERLLPLCAERGIAVLAGGPFNSGVLARPEPDSHFDYEPPDGAVLARARALREVCERHGVPLRAAALRYPLGHPAVAAVLPGARSPEQVDDLADLFALPIPAALWVDLIRTGLLPPGTPVPVEEG